MAHTRVTNPEPVIKTKPSVEGETGRRMTETKSSVVETERKDTKINDARKPSPTRGQGQTEREIIQQAKL